MDPQQEQAAHAANLMAGMGVGVILLACLFFIVFLLFVMYLLWRIFAKAGLSGALSLLVLVPGFGSLIVLCVLAFADWKVTPIVAAPYYPPTYPPPPPAFPPTQV